MSTQTSGKTVFFTGATGYIGGTALSYIIGSPAPPKKITALIRDPKKADLLTSLSLAKEKGVELVPLVGSLEELEKVRDAAAEHDVVVSTANADDLPGIKAIIEGMKLRKEKTGHRSLLIHTSGTGVLVDKAKGDYPNDIIYTDLNPTPATRDAPALRSMTELSPSAPHREVDLAIIEADKAGLIKSYIILPSTIWGAGKGEVYDKGLSNSFSDQIPTLIKAGLDRGRAGMVGEGKNIWPHVKITDLGNLYSLVYQKATQQNPTIGHGPSGYYFGIAGEYTLFGATSRIGQALVKNKLVDTKETTPTTFNEEDLKKYYGGSTYMGTNSRGVADRSKSIGWKPKYDQEDDLFQHIDSEAPRVAKEFGKEWKVKKFTSAY
ncbi:NAD dependent epimerase/dehydratase [Kwoniella heveanensis CBS 569]|nr:NAD dependent epimerase/dehydratase [Kwoniella heveanensis CBS 569]